MFEEPKPKAPLSLQPVGTRKDGEYTVRMGGICWSASPLSCFSGFDRILARIVVCLNVVGVCRYRGTDLKTGEEILLVRSIEVRDRKPSTHQHSLHSFSVHPHAEHS